MLVLEHTCRESRTSWAMRVVAQLMANEAPLLQELRKLLAQMVVAGIWRVQPEPWLIEPFVLHGSARRWFVHHRLDAYCFGCPRQRQHAEEASVALSEDGVVAVN